MRAVPSDAPTEENIMQSQCPCARRLTRPWACPQLLEVRLGAAGGASSLWVCSCLPSPHRLRATPSISPWRRAAAVIATAQRAETQTRLCAGWRRSPRQPQRRKRGEAAPSASQPAAPAPRDGSRASVAQADRRFIHAVEAGERGRERRIPCTSRRGKGQDSRTFGSARTEQRRQGTACLSVARMGARDPSGPRR